MLSSPAPRAVAECQSSRVKFYSKMSRSGFTFHLNLTRQAQGKAHQLHRTVEQSVACMLFHLIHWREKVYCMICRICCLTHLDDGRERIAAPLGRSYWPLVYAIRWVVFSITNVPLSLGHWLSQGPSFELLSNACCCPEESLRRVDGLGVVS